MSKQRHKSLRGTGTQFQLEFTLSGKREGEREREKGSWSLRSDHSCQVELCGTEHVHPIYGKGQRSEKAITGQFSSLLAIYCCWWGAEHSERRTAGCLSDVIYNTATLLLLSLLFSPY